MKNSILYKAVLFFVYLGIGTNCFAVNGFLPGAGTQEDPYVIEDLQDFLVFAAEENTGYRSAGVWVVLATDIDLSGQNFSAGVIATGQWRKYYYGNFDGNGFGIYNLKINSNSDYVGLFACISEGSVSNLNIVNADVNSTGSYVGVLCGRV